MKAFRIESIAIAALLAVHMASATVQEACEVRKDGKANIAGHWEGELSGDGDQPVRVTLDLDKNEKSEWIASMGIPEENMTGLVVQDVTVEDKRVKFVAVELMMTPFELTLGSEGTLKGTTSGRAAQPVEFRRTGEAKVELITASPAVSEQLEGLWKGTLQTPRRGVPMAFHFKNQPDNTVIATISTGVGEDLPLNDVKQTGQKVEFGMKIAQSSFEGTLNEEGTELVGMLTTGGGPLPLTLRKTQLQLHGKTILICPILLGKPSDDDDAWKYSNENAVYLGVTLERGGMLPALSPRYPASIMEEETLVEVMKQLQAVRKQWKIETDYIFFARFEMKQKDKDFGVRARAVMADATGRIVWSQDPEEFSEGSNIWPIMLCKQLSQTLCAASDLQDPNRTSDPGPFEEEMQEKMRSEK